MTKTTITKTLASLLALVVPCLPACASTVQPVRGPDGQQWLAIECRHSQANCYQAAGEACPAGYDIADNSGGASGAVAYSSGNMTVVNSKYRGQMLVKCKPLVTIRDVN